MRLKHIKLAGFKSFVDPTTIPFPSNLVGIVGPNGCGKSNTIDAVRWVMGESSAKQLRGDSMSDVIFNGTTSRKPVSAASVELVFDNSEGKLGGQYGAFSEISVKRKVVRDGTSNYYLNGTKCRRRDIMDVFMGTGLGPRSYAIIEQGMISRIVEAKPEDLRLIVEEASGISRYKERRRETETRIRHARENLDRLNDLREELDKQLRRLERQAEAATKYRAYKEEERGLQSELLALRWRALETHVAEQAQAVREAEVAVEKRIAELRELEARIEELREQQIKAQETLSSVQGRYYAAGADIARVEQTLNAARERAQQLQQDLEQAQAAQAEAQRHRAADRERKQLLEAEIAQVEPQRVRAEDAAKEARERRDAVEQDWNRFQAEWDAFSRDAGTPERQAHVEQARIQHLEQQQLQQQRRIARIGEELSELQGQTGEEALQQLEATVHSSESALQQLQGQQQDQLQSIQQQRGEVERLDREAGTLRSQIQQQQGRVASLETLQGEALGKRGGVLEWLRARGKDKAPRVAETLQVTPGWERAVETVLRMQLDAVVVDEETDLLRDLPSIERGRAGLIHRSAAAVSAASNSLGASLAQQVQTDTPLQSWLEDVFVAEDLDAAMTMRAQLARHQSIVTREGLWIGPNWSRVDRGEDQGSVIEREAELRETRTSLERAQQEFEQLQAQLQGAREALQQHERAREQLQQQIGEATREASRHQAELSSRRNRITHAQQRVVQLEHERAELQEALQTAETEIQQARVTLEQATEAMAVVNQKRQELEQQRESLRSMLDQARRSSGERKDQLHRLTLQLETARSRHESVLRSLERVDAQLIDADQRQQTLQENLQQAQGPLPQLEAELQTALEARRVVERELTDARTQMASVEHDLRSSEQSRSGQEASVNQAREQVTTLRIAAQEMRVRQQTVAEQLQEAGADRDQILASLPEDAHADDWESRLAELNQRIQRLGAINLAAIEEFQTESERKEYLDAQHNDLVSALETLEGAIRRIDKETRTRFKDTFDLISTGLQKNFPRLFGGGHAYLELTGEDLLDAGVNVIARPPGKRNSSIHLLSGGEKALTAVALVFSIFELNPAPFCMLDEVDAPLDDANIGRFCKLVNEMSQRVQFIFITHRKPTMEIAQHLSGVTMHEPGVSRLVAVDVDAAADMAAA